MIGPRRSGKTTQMLNIISSLLENNVPKTHILYINFEDERYAYTTKDLDILMQAYLELYPENKLSDCYFFFDEIQIIDHWDRFVRRIYDTYSKNIFLTGSNAKLLSKEIATALRGRTLSYPILPLSFHEYCRFMQIDTNYHPTLNKAKILHHLPEYLYYGGFPEIITYDQTLKIKTLQNYFDTMIYRDMIERYQIKNPLVIKYFLKRLFSSVTKSVSINKIYNEMSSSGIKIAKQTLYDYLEMSENIFLAMVLKKHSSTIVHQELGERKIYIVDNGLLNAMTYKFSNDIGKCMEQVVLQELIRREQTVFFYKNKYECDFIIQRGFDIVEAIQVSYNIDNNSNTLEREINGLIEACHYFDLNHGIIINNEKEETIQRENIEINIVPLFKWLLRFPSPN